MRQTAKDRKIEALSVDLFNASVPVGAEVLVELDDGTTVRRRTRSEAWLLGCSIGVVKIEGIAGGYALSRVKIPWESTRMAAADRAKEVPA